MNDQLDLEIMSVLRTRGASMTYVIANLLRMIHKKHNCKLTTAHVLRRLKSMERRSLVKRVSSIYAAQLCWSAT